MIELLTRGEVEALLELGLVRNQRDQYRFTLDEWADRRERRVALIDTSYVELVIEDDFIYVNRFNVWGIVTIDDPETFKIVGASRSRAGLFA
jgi:hypothetical protein